MPISQTTVVKSYGAPEINVHVPFIAPPPPSAACATAKPIVGQVAVTVAPTGGSIAGGQNLYYHLAAVDLLGNESIPSDPIEVIIPPGTNTNQVSLAGISPFDSSAASFHVYRSIGAPNGVGATAGGTPARLFSSQAVPTNCSSLSVTDTGSNGDNGGVGDPTKMPISQDVNKVRAYWQLAGESQWRFGGETLNGQGSAVDFVVPHNVQGQSINVQLRSVDRNLNETPESLAPIASYTIAAAYPTAIGIGAAPPVGSGFAVGGTPIIDNSGRTGIDSLLDGANYVRGAQNAGSAITLDNANFVAGTSGWSALDANATISQVSSSPFTNGKALQVSTASQFDGAGHTRRFKANPGDKFFMSCWVNSDGTFLAKVQISYLDGSGAFLGSDGAVSSSTSWTQVSFTGTAPANTATIQIVLIRADATGGTHICWFTNPHVVRVASLDNEVGDGLTFRRLLHVETDNKIHVSTALNPQGGLVSYGSNVGFSDSTTTTSIGIWNTAFTIYNPDGSTFSAPATGSSGSPAWNFTGLTANTTFHFGAYYDVAAGTITVVMSDNRTSIGSIQWQVQTINGDGRIPLFIDWTIATPSSGTGGGTGGGGGGGTCFCGDTRVRTAHGLMEFAKLPLVVEIENRTGKHLADVLLHERHSGEMIDTGFGLVTPEHLIADGELWVPASAYFAGRPRIQVRDITVFNLHVRTGDDVARHYILESGDIAHNFKQFFQ